jgi:acylphosphatase
MKICKRCFINGLVQGVSFRYHTRREALRLQLSGWARNLPDGRVDVVVCGEKEAVEELCRWLNHGPSLAQVTDVNCREIEGTECPKNDFEIG